MPWDFPGLSQGFLKGGVLTSGVIYWDFKDKDGVLLCSLCIYLTSIRKRGISTSSCGFKHIIAKGETEFKK